MKTILLALSSILPSVVAWHATAEVYALRFFEANVLRNPRFQRSVNILDVGGADFNGSFRSALRASSLANAIANVNITVADLAPGPGVNVVLEHSRKLLQLPFPDGAFDIVVTTSCFEHDRFFWHTFTEIARVVNPQDGLIYLNAPSNGHYHAYPRDYWRFYPDAASALADWAELSGFPVKLCQSFIGAGNVLHDFVAVFSRGAGKCLARIDPMIEALQPATHCACANPEKFHDMPRGPYFER